MLLPVLRRFLRPYRRDVLLVVLLQFLQTIAALSLPTLLLWGSEDTIVDRDTTMRTLIAIPGAGNLEVLRGVGHSPMIESPVVLAERIIDFIAEDFAEYAEARDYAEERAREDDDDI